MKMLTICALALGALVATSSTSFAAPPPIVQFGFGFNFGDGNGFDRGPRLRDCEDEDQILSDLADQGYRRLDVVDSTRHELTIDARRGPRAYELTVDRCSGEVFDRQRQ